MNLDQRIHAGNGLGYNTINMVMSPNITVSVSIRCGEVSGNPVFISSDSAISAQITTFLSKIQVDAKRKLDLANRFNALASQWKIERSVSSSATKAVLCPSYQRIIALGPDAIALILGRLREEGDEPDFWFWALENMSGENPVSEDDIGDFRAMAQAWLRWGYHNGKLVAR